MNKKDLCFCMNSAEKAVWYLKNKYNDHILLNFLYEQHEKKENSVFLLFIYLPI